MKTAYTVLVLLVAIVAVVFALQNSAAITITLLGWSLSGSLSLFLIVTLAIGFLLGTLSMAGALFKRGRLSSGLKRQIASLEKEKAALDSKATEGEPTLAEEAQPTNEKSEPAKGRG